MVPDIQAIEKALGAGYAPISASLVNEQIITGLKQGGGYFSHGQTYQTYPAICAAASEVQKFVEEESLLANVRCMANCLGFLLHTRLDSHPNVGDVRGRCFFWAMKFVSDRVFKTPLGARFKVAK